MLSTARGIIPGIRLGGQSATLGFALSSANALLYTAEETSQMERKKEEALV